LTNPRQDQYAFFIWTYTAIRALQARFSGLRRPMDLFGGPATLGSAPDQHGQRARNIAAIRPLNKSGINVSVTGREWFSNDCDSAANHHLDWQRTGRHFP